MAFDGKKLTIMMLGLVLAVLVIAGATGIRVADANQCAAQCYAQFGACSQKTKGSPACQAALSSCLASCRGGR